MKKLQYRVLLVVLGVVLAIIGIGCAGSASAKAGTLTFNVTDAPPKPDITSIMITIASLEVHRAAAAQTPTTTATTPTTATTTTTETTTGTETGDDGGEWLTIDIPAGAETFDLLEIKGIEQLLTSVQITEGFYTQVRLGVEKAEVSIAGGELQPATVPSGTLKVVRPFEVVAGETTIITLDFDADKSVNVTGNDNIVVKPVIKLLVNNPKGPSPSEFNQTQSQELAEEFILNGPTFVFDGIADSLELMNTVVLATPKTWQFTFRFDCAHAGYGDRTGQMLAEVITTHEAVVTVDMGNVVSAVLDGKWNEITQEMIPEPPAE